MSLTQSPLALRKTSIRALKQTYIYYSTRAGFTHVGANASKFFKSQAQVMIARKKQNATNKKKSSNNTANKRHAKRFKGAVRNEGHIKNMSDDDHNATNANDNDR